MSSTSETAGHGSPVRWLDQHCHLPPEQAEAELLLAEAGKAGVLRLIDVGCDLDSSRACVERASRYPAVSATAGVHPHEASGGIDGLADLLESPHVVAVGECGLDYHYEHSPIDVQRNVFAAQIELAAERGLPLVIHTREAWDDTFAILAASNEPPSVVFHCFTGGPRELDRCLDMGAVVSFSGIVTFKSAQDLQLAAARVPADRYLVETDAPWLAPVPHRGRPNRPGLVPVVGAAMAGLRGVAVAQVAEETWSTAHRTYPALGDPPT